MQNYFASEYDKISNIFLFNKEDTCHLVNVLKTKVNDNLIVVYEKIKYETIVIEIKPILKVKIIKSLKENNELQVKITLLMPILKNNRNDWIIQKATELGVSKIVPIHLKHSIIQLSNHNKLDNKIIRWKKIAKAASQQCNRNEIPIIANFESSFSSDTLKKYESNINIVSNELINLNVNLHNLLEKIPSTITLICGPEGGFTLEELSLLKDNNFLEINLGKRILRSETAMLTLLANISYFFENMKGN